MENIHSWVETAGVIVTAFATIALAWVTSVLAKETKRLAALGQQPQVIATIEASPRSMHWFDLHLENSGNATAFDIMLTFEPQPTLSRGDKVPFSKIPVLKPQQKLSSSFCTFAELQNREFSITTEWSRSPRGHAREKLNYLFSIKDFEGMSRLGGVPIVEMADSVKKISEELTRLGQGTRKLAVDVYNSEDRDLADKNLEEFYDRQRAKQKAIE